MSNILVGNGEREVSRQRRKFLYLKLVQKCVEIVLQVRSLIAEGLT